MKRKIYLPLFFFILPIATTGCGAKKGVSESKTESSAEKENKLSTTDKNKGNKIAEMINLLNKAITDGDSVAFEKIVSKRTINIMKDIVAFSPEEKGGGIQNPGTEEILSFEKNNSVKYMKGEPDPETGTDTIKIIENETEVGMGPVEIVEKEGIMMLDFEQAVQQRLEKIQSEGILRQKFLDVVSALNKAIDEGIANELKNLLTIDTLNYELKVRSYFVKYKKNLNLQLIVDNWKSQEAHFEVKNIDIHTQTGDLKLEGKKGIIYEGKCSFKTEIGKLKLDLSEILKAKLEELEAEEKASQKKK